MSAWYVFLTMVRGQGLSSGQSESVQTIESKSRQVVRGWMCVCVMVVFVRVFESVNLESMNGM